MLCRTSYTHDANDQLTGRQYPDGSRATFVYDAVGNRTTMKDTTGTYTTTYDALDRNQTVTNPADKTITYAYDTVGNRAHMIDPDAGRFTYAYDDADRIAHLENPQAERTSFTYDDAGNRTKAALANGTYTSFSYDVADQITQVANNFSDDTGISVFNYGYDPASNRTHSTELAGTRVTWTYDDANQLLSEHRDGPNVGTTGYNNTYAYDGSGNRLTKNDGTQLTTSTYDAGDQLKTTLDSSGTTTYTFDANGNQQRVQEPSGDRTTTTWDYENQPTLYELPSAERVTITYNADNDRVEKQSNSGTTKFIWDQQNYLLETDGAGITTCIYTNEPNVYGNAISQRRANETSYLHFDAIGSTREATDSSETITDTWVYDAFGNIINRTGTTLIFLGYIGKLGYYIDPETGLIWVRKRPLRPSTARWTSTDPLGFVDALNRYVVVGNDPVGFVDPSGQLTKSLTKYFSRYKTRLWTDDPKDPKKRNEPAYEVFFHKYTVTVDTSGCILDCAATCSGNAIVGVTFESTRSGILRSGLTALISKSGIWVPRTGAWYPATKSAAATKDVGRDVFVASAPKLATFPCKDEQWSELINYTVWVKDKKKPSKKPTVLYHHYKSTITVKTPKCGQKITIKFGLAFLDKKKTNLQGKRLMELTGPGDPKRPPHKKGDKPVGGK